MHFNIFDEIYIDELVVKDVYREKGIGTQLCFYLRPIR